MLGLKASGLCTGESNTRNQAINNGHRGGYYSLKSTPQLMLDRTTYCKLSDALL